VKSKLSSLESLRGVAALIVVIDHSVNMFAPHIRWTNIEGMLGNVRRVVAWTPLSIFYSGIPAVWIFFMLSGFVLSIKFLKSPNDLAPIIGGASKRYLRLVVPIIGAAIAFCAMAFVGCQAGSLRLCEFPFARVMIEAVWVAPFTHHKLINTPLWTISWELFGSLLIFGMLIVHFFIRNIIISVLLATIAVYILFNSNYSLFIIGLIICHLYFGGGILGIYNSDSYLKRLALILLFASALFLMAYPYPRDNVQISAFHSILYSSGEWYLDSTYYTKIGAIMFFIGFMVSPMAQRIIDNSVTRFLGYISFSMYILHYPIFFVVKNGFGISTLTLTQYVPFFAMVIVLLLVVSWIFAKYVDAFSIELSNRFGRWIVSVFPFERGALANSKQNERV